jgi:hypothetical protein
LDIASLYGDRGVGKLLIAGQIVLSLELRRYYSFVKYNIARTAVCTRAANPLHRGSNKDGPIGQRAMAQCLASIVAGMIIAFGLRLIAGALQ